MVYFKLYGNMCYYFNCVFLLKVREVFNVQKNNYFLKFSLAVLLFFAVVLPEVAVADTEIN